ncbi:MAG: MOSC domain-containing protein [Anaerolineae bacterium]
MSEADLRLSAIHIYPVKSCAGLALDAVALDHLGPSGDRRWMVVDAAGQFLSQRTLAHMALIEASVQSGGALQLRFQEALCQVPLPDSGSPRIAVSVWGDSVSALDAGEGAATWLSAVLGCECRLVYMPPQTLRRVDPHYARRGECVSFADGFPLLLISEASLEALNARLAQPVPMNRFRPNLVVSGCEPFAEDRWRRIRIGAVELEVVKPCSRCAIPSIEQSTAQRDPAINRALAGFRRFEGQILFGQNLLHGGPGELRRGDAVEVLD